MSRRASGRRNLLSSTRMAICETYRTFEQIQDRRGIQSLPQRLIFGVDGPRYG